MGQFSDIDLGRLAKERERVKSLSGRGDGKWWNFEQGETLAYVCPAIKGMRKFPFVEATIHFHARARGKGKGSALCLDQEINPLLKNEVFLERLKKARRDIDDLEKCAICPDLESDELDEKAKAEAKRSTRWLFNIIPMYYRRKPSDKWQPLSEGICPIMVGWTIYDGICAQFGDIGNISDPLSAILVKVTRIGKQGDRNTKYTVGPDPKTLQEHLKLPRELRDELAEKLKPEGAADLLRIVASMTKDATAMEAAWNSMEEDGSEDDKDRKDRGGKKKPSCFGVDYDEDERSCRKCEHSDDCQEESGGKKPKDDEEEEKPRKKHRKDDEDRPRKRKDEDEDEDEDDEKKDDDDEDEDDERSSKKSKKHKQDDDEDEENEDEDEKPRKKSKKDDDEDEDEDEEEEKPRKKHKKHSDDDEDDRALRDLERRIRKGKG